MTANRSRTFIIRMGFILSLIALVVCCVTLLKKTVPFEIQTLLASNNPARIQYEEDLKSFNDEASAWLVVRRSEPFTPNEIEALSRRIALVMEMDHAFEAIRGPQNAKYFEFDGDRFKLTPFIDEGVWSPKAETRLRSEAWRNSLLREDRRAFLFSFRFRQDLARRDEKPAVDRLERSLKTITSENPGVSTALLGAKIASASFLSEMSFQQKVITPLLILILAAFLWACYRSWQIVVWNLVVMFICYASTLCLIILLEGGLGPYSSFSLMFAFIVATTDLIHFFARFQNLTGSVQERLNTTLKIARVPCLLTSLTTAAGFLALVVNQNLPIRYFGIYCAFSCLLEWAIIFGVLPTLLVAFNFRAGTSNWQIPRLAKAVGPWVTRHAKPIVVISSIAIVAAVFATYRLRVDDNFYTKFVNRHPLSRAIETFSEEFDFVGSIDVIVKPTVALTSPEVMDKLRSFESDLSKQPVISKISSFRQIEDELAASLSRSTVPVDSRLSVQESVSQLLLDYGSVRDFVNEGKGELRTVVFLKSLATADLDAVLEYINSLAEKYRNDFQVRPAGFSVIRSFINHRVIRDFAESFLLSFVLIFACYLWLYRSLKWSLIALIPNALPLLAISGLMGLFRVPVDTNLVILICVVFGIAGDNTIHLTYVLRTAPAGESYQQALEKAWRLIGVAMIGTCGAFLFCLPVFLLGSLKLFNQVAIFLSIAFIAAFFSDTILFPAFQIRMGWRRH